MTTDALVSRACPLIYRIGAAHFFSPEAETAAADIGVDQFTLYVLGRGGVLGDVEPVVVSSAFGYFNPSLVATMWDAARTVMAPREAGHAFMGCSAAFGRRTFGHLEGLEAFCAAAGAVNEAADNTGLALYAGIKTEPLVDDAPGRAMQLVTVLREFRGSAHLIALRASGLEAKTAHHIRRPNDGALFGWSEDDAPMITAEDRATWAIAEQLTDRIVLPAYAVLDQAGREALVAGLAAMENALLPA